MLSSLQRSKKIVGLWEKNKLTEKLFEIFVSHFSVKFNKGTIQKYLII